MKQNILNKVKKKIKKIGDIFSHGNIRMNVTKGVSMIIQACSNNQSQISYKSILGKSELVYINGTGHNTKIADQSDRFQQNLVCSMRDSGPSYCI